MTSLPEQFSAARMTQLDNGFNLMRTLGDQALDSASRVLALQLGASRAALEQSSNAVRQLMDVRDPRDLLAFGSQSQQALRSMFDYSRELFSIATSMNLPQLRTLNSSSASASAPVSAPAPLQAAPAPQVPLAQVAAEAFERTGGDSASAAAASAASAAASQAASKSAAAGADFVLPTETPPREASLAVVTSDIEPAATPKPIALATGEALDLPVAPPHPVAASVPVEVSVEIELPKIAPVDAAPPVAAPASTGPVETRGTKGRKKQS